MPWIQINMCPNFFLVWQTCLERISQEWIALFSRSRSFASSRCVFSVFFPCDWDNVWWMEWWMLRPSGKSAGFAATPVSRVPPRSINICCVLVYHIIYDIHISFTIYFLHNIHVIYIYIWFCGYSCVTRPPKEHKYMLCASISYHIWYTYFIYHIFST